MKPIDQLSDDELAPLLRGAVAMRDAPPAWVHAAIGLWPAVQPSPLRAALLRVQAVLRSDSWAGGPLVQGMRSVGAPTRHLLFSAQGLDIDLRISAEGEAFLLSGQILGPVEAGTLEVSSTDVALGAGGGTAPLRTVLDDLGEFQLGGVPRGRHQLALQVGDTLIELPAIDVGAAAP